MTNDTFVQLNQLVDKFGTEDFAILGFPSSQFKNQCPGATFQQIYNCLKYVTPGSGFEPNFLMFEKSNVNGPVETINPVFAWLKSACGPSGPTLFDTVYVSWTPVMYNDIEWNFAKFLISKTGKIVKRYSSQTYPVFLTGDIAELLLE
ncbi:hypothetical protein SAMD00019534_096110 [Acytostelium subglobosum LB1]|uniref:hypothetical protein n=1 Tax=Acytostelium subglobosum LB1 TaxID=1410327 RepID=UPI000644DA93|nr:hypothetical protein SAMD00019534_096110 [Acytostelium subglobosum LB1]GAM26436.1 hypothetical protein SAMD00019534_096110 [Acytostelium subglobosum LB1]|eukprot:XP_012750532.1 hypothetical protein SAMD00019534_096110 [Acytostelium subglobosum LB1]